MVTYAETAYETWTKTGRPNIRNWESCKKGDSKSSKSCLRKMV